MLFQQTAAPVGWTKITTSDNTALRVTSGSVQTGGVLDFTAAFTASIATSGTVASHALTVAQMPSHAHAANEAPHNHDIFDPGHAHGLTAAREIGSAQSGSGDRESQNQAFATSAALTGINNTLFRSTGITIGANGGNAAHTHGYTGNPIALNVKYVDVIIAQKA